MHHNLQYSYIFLKFDIERYVVYIDVAFYVKILVLGITAFLRSTVSIPGKQNTQMCTGSAHIIEPESGADLCTLLKLLKLK